MSSSETNLVGKTERGHCKANNRRFSSRVFIILFIYLFLAVLGLCCCLGFSLVMASGGHSSFWCPRLLLQWLLFSWGMGSTRVRASVVAAHELSSCSLPVLEHRLSSCGARAYMWGLPGPGIKPMSPALAGRFFTTESPGKPIGSLLHANNFNGISFNYQNSPMR